jgi:hypothetical protein
MPNNEHFKKFANEHQIKLENAINFGYGKDSYYNKMM